MKINEIIQQIKIELMLYDKLLQAKKSKLIKKINKKEYTFKK